MWISKRFGSKKEPAAETGTFTVSSDGFTEATGTLQSRNSECFSPYGYSFCAPVGEKVLIINSSSGAVCAGTEMKKEKLEQGEICISSSGGASIVLKNNGDVVLNGLVINSAGEISN
ncbi:MAG: hypothetical protein LUG21_07540 [Clostridiales bacterium]|nr:hypothetical protein [Clostridiales bacterium]